VRRGGGVDNRFTVSLFMVLSGAWVMAGGQGDNRFTVYTVTCFGPVRSLGDGRWTG
jgi:hypothetical protein